MSTRAVYIWLRVVEATSVPLSVFLMLYVLSGYGMILPDLTRLVGFSYRVSAYLHGHPTLRYLTTVLIALHGYGGFVLLVNRHVRNAAINRALMLLGLAYAVLLVSVSTVVELVLLFSK